MFQEYPKMIYKDEQRSERRIVQNAEEEKALLALWQPKGSLDKVEAAGQPVDEAPAEDKPEEKKKNPALMSKVELVEYAKGLGVELDPAMKKTEMLAAIK